MHNWEQTLEELQNGAVRAAQWENGDWKVNRFVKESILEAFKEGENINCSGNYQGFVDKHNILPQEFSLSRGVRMVPGGSSVRRGAFIAEGVIIMPPAYVNIGAYVDSGTMIDSHVLVGSCAQIGKNVHLSAGVQIGGVLEPIGQRPVIIEDNAFIGAGAVIVEGIMVRKNAVIAPGVVLSRSVPVFDLVHQRKLEPGSDIPEGAVVISGTRTPSSEWAQQQGLNVYCPLIVKYRDEKSDASLVLEDVLR